jgi:sulfur carrier protein ThiS adenylyltransferase
METQKYPLSEEEYDKMLIDRQGEAVWSKLKNAHVAIAGLGGLGSHIAIELVRAGVGSLHLIDFDKVEPSNLNRQCYTMHNLGQYKTQALSDQLYQINPYVKLRTDTVRVTEENLVELFQEDFYICEAFDRPEAKAMLVNGILEHFPEKILVSGSGMAGYESSNMIVTKRVLPNFYLCGDGVTAAVNGRGLIATRVTICAAHEANMMVRVILGEREV